MCVPQCCYTRVHVDDTCAVRLHKYLRKSIRVCACRQTNIQACVDFQDAESRKHVVIEQTEQVRTSPPPPPVFSLALPKHQVLCFPGPRPTPQGSRTAISTSLLPPSVFSPHLIGQLLTHPVLMASVHLVLMASVIGGRKN